MLHQNETIIKKIEIMLEGYTNTGKTVTFSNNKTVAVYSKETKKGERFYYWSFGRMLPVAKKDINQ